uniref:Cwf21 domain-containing protein n=1 Tax=Globodera pallida TaxID=36090 RepID=A0A183CL73_GLOPA
MYNNVGLPTARGSGTNAFIQANLSNLGFSRNKIQYNAEEDIAKSEAEVNKAPNIELLDHEYKRLIEIKCVEFEDLMEGKGFSESEINSKVNEYRKLLFNEFESGRLDMDTELDVRNTHSRAKVAKDNRNKWRSALGIDAAFVDGSSLEKLKKASDSVIELTKTMDKKNLDKEMEKSLMEKLMEKIKKEKEKKKERKKMRRAMRKESSSDSSDSSSDSSTSSDSDDSSSTTTTDSSSEEERAKRKGKAKRKRSEETKVKKEPVGKKHRT